MRWISQKQFTKILPKLTDRLPSRCLTRREETALSRLHIGQSHAIHLFLLKGEEPPFCVCCNKPLSLEHILLFCSDLIDIIKIVLQCKVAEGVVQRGFFGYHLQLFERD